MGVILVGVLVIVLFLGDRVMGGGTGPTVQGTSPVCVHACVHLCA